MRTLIKNGKIATASDIFYGDILIEDELIKRIDTEITERCDRMIDAAGKLIIPGGIDVHTHFNLHTGSAIARDDFYSGTVAAACGGTTSIIDHMGFGPAGCDLGHQLKVYHQYAEGEAVVDYGFHGVIQHVNQDVIDQVEVMIKALGVPSMKLYMTYDYRLGNASILRVMEQMKTMGGLLTVHAENHEIIEYLRNMYLEKGLKTPIYHAKSRPDYSEEEAVNRLINLAATADNAPLYIVHLTTAAALQQIKRAQAAQKPVYAETCPQYLLLDEFRYLQDIEEGLKYILSPPLRSQRDCDALWQGIREGVIQVVATDHCPFSIKEEKQLGREDFSKCPNGMPGVEERIPLMFSEGVMQGRISLNKLVETCCTNPAKLFGIYPQKGSLLPGSDGDIVIIDPEKEVTLTQGQLHSRVDYTAYEGFRLKGYPVMTLSRGEVIVQNNQFVGAKGRGRFLKRKITNQQI